jgi:adenosylmethionine-8-amino-7-oxononanoate aminotransferase
MDLGLMCYPGSGTINGVHGNHILLAPAFIIQPAQVHEIVEKLAQAIDAAVKRLEQSKVPLFERKHEKNLCLLRV